MENKYLTEKVLHYFKVIVDESLNWSGMPIFEGEKTEKGYLTNLKKAGLITTEQDEDNKHVQWICFTDKGLELAKEMCLDVSEIESLLGRNA